MKECSDKVDALVESFTLKTDRIIKDFRLRFDDFGRYTIQLQHLTSTVEYLKTQNQSKTAK